jgi:hypothetical protein
MDTLKVSFSRIPALVNSDTVCRCEPLFSSCRMFASTSLRT